MLIETNRLLLRPLELGDTAELARVVFSDPDVVGMLAHNTKVPEDAEAEAQIWAHTMGIDGAGGIWDDGGMGLFAVVPKDAGVTLAGVAGFYMERNERGRWTGEYFYALGSDWHGQGLMSEAADAFAEKLRSMEDLGVIYADYWDLINEASGRLLVRTGFKPVGRKLVTEEYGADRCLRMFDYDLWRLCTAGRGVMRDKVLTQVARRAGAYVAEDLVGEAETLDLLRDHYDSGPLHDQAEEMFGKAMAYPGIAYLEIRGEGETGKPVNGLG